MPEETQGTNARPALCPSCERFVGPAGTCPYCNADVPKPLVLRMLKGGAWLMAVVGLVALYLAATGREVSVVRIADISPMMNYAYVRVVGDVERAPYVSRTSGNVDYLSFRVADETGSLRVQVHGKVAERIALAGAIPSKGDRVDVAGSLFVRSEGSVRMRLQSPRQLVLIDAKSTSGER